MSIRILKAGILDTIQDLGRTGGKHLGINPSGAMDCFSAQIANILVGNTPSEAVIEFHFPAATLQFVQPALIVLSGADFSATINQKPIPLHQPVFVGANSVLRFAKWQSGAWCYLAIREKWDIPPWLGSYSTNLKAKMSGFQGRALQKGDEVPFREHFTMGFQHPNQAIVDLPTDGFEVCTWKAASNWGDPFVANEIAVIEGSEWHWLTKKAQRDFWAAPFRIAAASDRMAYRMEGALLKKQKQNELLSSAVGFGTIQLLPNGTFLVLMADHQTTGGYPRIAHVISAHHAKLAQMPIHTVLHFVPTDLVIAERLYRRQQRHLAILQHACRLRMKG